MSAGRVTTASPPLPPAWREASNGRRTMTLALVSGSATGVVSVYLDGVRIAGPKPKAGGGVKAHVIRDWQVIRADVEAALEGKGKR